MIGSCDTNKIYNLCVFTRSSAKAVNKWRFLKKSCDFIRLEFPIAICIPPMYSFIAR